MAVSISYAPKAKNLLRGLFAVYKPTGTPIKALINEVQSRLVNDINQLEQRPQKQMVVFKPVSSSNVQNKFDLVTDESRCGNSIPTLVPDWFDHPLVQGPRYNKDDFVLSTGHALDVHACGVQVLGLHRKGGETLEKLKKLTLPRRYKAKGQFGLASSTYSGESKIVERSTWDHVTEEKIIRILTIIQGTHRNACIMASGIDLSSQQAYLMASKGLLRPHAPTDSVIIDIKLSEMKLPEFTLDVTCINESCMFVRKIIHEIGLELRSSAICTHLQRQQDSVFAYDDKHTLLGHQINTKSVIDSIQYSHFMLDQGVLKKRRHFKKTTLRLTDGNEPLPSEASLRKT